MTFQGAEGSQTKSPEEVTKERGRGRVSWPSLQGFGAKQEGMGSTDGPVRLETSRKLCLAASSVCRPPELSLDPQQEPCQELWAAVPLTTDVASTLSHCLSHEWSSPATICGGSWEMVQAAAGSLHCTGQKAIGLQPLCEWMMLGGPHWGSMRTTPEDPAVWPAGGPCGSNVPSSGRCSFKIRPNICAEEKEFFSLFAHSFTMERRWLSVTGRRRETEGPKSGTYRNYKGPRSNPGFT